MAFRKPPATWNRFTVIGHNVDFKPVNILYTRKIFVFYEKTYYCDFIEETI